MRKYRIGAALVAGFAMMLAGPLSAQQRQQAPNSNLNAEDQLSPSQMQQPMPGAVAAPTGAPGHAPAKHTATAGSPAAAAVRSNAAIAASRYGHVLKVSEDGLVSHYSGGRCVWEL